MTGRHAHSRLGWNGASSLAFFDRFSTAGATKLLVKLVNLVCRAHLQAFPGAADDVRVFEADPKGDGEGQLGREEPGEGRAAKVLLDELRRRKLDRLSRQFFETQFFSPV
ncbi:MAG TPA: hypothetical protein VFY87_31065 [Geminicoccaceae bacterium]|nr:hypothetical protein [Geminicoccaceae bacterium]